MQANRREEVGMSPFRMHRLPEAYASCELAGPSSYEEDFPRVRPSCR